MKTHRERSEEARSTLLLATDRYRDRETGEELTATAVIARETYPTELVEAARTAERYIAHTCPKSQALLLEHLRDTLAAYDDRHDQEGR